MKKKETKQKLQERHFDGIYAVYLLKGTVTTIKFIVQENKNGYIKLKYVFKIVYIYYMGALEIERCTLTVRSFKFDFNSTRVYLLFFCSLLIYLVVLNEYVCAIVMYCCLHISRVHYYLILSFFFLIKFSEKKLLTWNEWHDRPSIQENKYQAHLLQSILKGRK